MSKNNQVDPVERAFRVIKRKDFLPDDIKHKADLDSPLPIGYGQTNSQPSTVRRMLEWLEVQKNEKILDVGSGSGWTSALLANLVGKEGRVYAVEKVPQLKKFGEDNCSREGIDNVAFFEAGEVYGLPRHAPYDRILVSAAAGSLPDELLQQLKVGGRAVIPVEGSVHVIDKLSSDKFRDMQHPGYLFVPLIKHQ
ncbi:MAG: protein-L-isoaspartate O-methyltransferase [Candidatus Saccharibacteria bacterium]|nr:protein-L-isoaspartate O-methyltransferase [Candidatus Saccharibacteria bacterium]